MGMEVVNELGAVRLLGIPSLSAGILQAWQLEGNPAGAVGLALVTLDNPEALEAKLSEIAERFGEHVFA